MTEGQAPPLWCFPSALILAVLCGLFLGHEYIIYGSGDQDFKISEEYGKYLQEALSKGSDEERTFVILGSSYLSYAVLEPIDFSKLCFSVDGSKVKLVRVLFSSGVPRLPKGLVEYFRVSPPDVLIVQDNALGYFQRPVTLRQFMKKRILALLPLDRAMQAREFFFKEPRATDYRVVGPLKIKHARKRRSATYSEELREDIIDIIDVSSQLGADVSIVTVPVAKRWEATLSDHKHELSNKIKQFFGERGISYLTCPLEFSEQDYIDLSHMNYEASARYSEWLVEQIFKKEERELD